VLEEGATKKRNQKEMYRKKEQAKYFENAIPNARITMQYPYSNTIPYPTLKNFLLFIFCK
jgi:hypothetical protein